MGLRTFNLPDPGEGLVEAEIVTWRVAAGDTVAVNDIVVEIETAKSLVELPIPWAGTVVELLVEQGTTVEVGTPIIRIEVEGAGDAPATAASVRSGKSDGGTTPEPAKREPNLVGYGAIEGSSRRRARKPAAASLAAASAPASASASVQGSAPASAAATGGPGRGSVASDDLRDAASPRPSRPADPVPPGPPQQVDAAGPERGSGASAETTPSAAGGPQGGPTVVGTRPLAKPPVRKYAKDRGVDLAAVTPSAQTGIVSRADVDAFLASGGTADGGGGAPGTAAAAAGFPAYLGGEGEREVRIPVKGVRKVTAEAMVASAFTAPHVTEFVTIDVTATKELMARLAGDREMAGARVTELLFVAKALLIACRRNPGVNATWDPSAGETGEIVQKRYVNLGIAAATPRGLMVPNIKDADRLTLRELADALTALVTTAREGRTQPADMAGGTITITNVGVFGIDTGTPIINPGESAILAMGAIRRQPWVVEAPDGAGGTVERIEPRWVTQLALSFDHRLIDGDLGSRFLADVAAVLHDPTRALVWG